MPSYNKLILVGHLTRDPELRYTPKGTAIAQSGIAMNRVWTADSGERKEEVTFLDWKAFGRSAETLSQYVKKGHAIMLEGRITTDSWYDKQTGQKRYKTLMVVESFRFLNNYKPEGEARQPRTPTAKSPESTSDEGGGFGQDSGDDVPF